MNNKKLSALLVFTMALALSACSEREISVTNTVETSTESQELSELIQEESKNTKETRNWKDALIKREEIITSPHDYYWGQAIHVGSIKPYDYEVYIENFTYSKGGKDYEIPIVNIKLKEENRDDKDLHEKRQMVRKVNHTFRNEAMWTLENDFDFFNIKVKKEDLKKEMVSGQFLYGEEYEFMNPLEIKSIYKIGRYLCVEYAQVGVWNNYKYTSGDVGRYTYGLIVDTLSGKRVMLGDLIEIDDRLYDKMKSCSITDDYEYYKNYERPGIIETERRLFLFRYLGDFCRSIDVTEKEWTKPMYMYVDDDTSKPTYESIRRSYLRYRPSFYMIQNEIVVYSGTDLGLHLYLPYGELSDIFKQGDPRESGDGECYPIYIVDEFDNTVDVPEPTE